MFFFFNDTATTEIYTLSLHDALPISDAQHHAAAAEHDDHPRHRAAGHRLAEDLRPGLPAAERHSGPEQLHTGRDRKSTRLNSSHANISYAVFCLKKKKKNTYFVRWHI